MEEHALIWGFFALKTHSPLLTDAVPSSCWSLQPCLDLPSFCLSAPGLSRRWWERAGSACRRRAHGERTLLMEGAREGESFLLKHCSPWIFVTACKSARCIFVFDTDPNQFQHSCFSTSPVSNAYFIETHIFRVYWFLLRGLNPWIFVPSNVLLQTALPPVCRWLRLVGWLPCPPLGRALPWLCRCVLCLGLFPFSGRVAKMYSLAGAFLCSSCSHLSFFS